MLPELIDCKFWDRIVWLNLGWRSTSGSLQIHFQMRDFNILLMQKIMDALFFEMAIDFVEIVEDVHNTQEPEDQNADIQDQQPVVNEQNHIWKFLSSWNCNKMLKCILFFSNPVAMVFPELPASFTWCPLDKIPSVISTAMHTTLQIHNWFERNNWWIQNIKSQTWNLIL